MADNLNETLNELKDTVMPSLFPPLMHSIEELTKVTLRTGRDYGENFKGLTDQFRGLDVSMKDVTQMLGQSIQTGVDIQGVNKQLIIDVKRLGFNLGSFMSTMGTFEQVLGMNETTTGNLIDATIDFAATFGRNADQLVKVMGTLVEPMARISNAFGATAAAGFAESIVGLGAAMGPMMAERLGPVMSKFITSDLEGFRRAALAGGGMGAMESPEQMIGLAQGVISRIDRLVTPGAPFTAGIAAQMFGLTQADVNVLRQLANVNMSQLAMAEEASRIEMAKKQATELFTDELAELQLELQSALMPLITASTEMISNIFTAFKEVLPKFNNDIINFTTELGNWIRKNVTSENIESGLRAFGEVAKIGIEYFKIAKAYLMTNVPEWFAISKNFFVNELPAIFDNTLAAIKNAIYAVPAFFVGLFDTYIMPVVDKFNYFLDVAILSFGALNAAFSSGKGLGLFGGESMFDVMVTHMRVAKSPEYQKYQAEGGQLSPYGFERRPQDIASAEANIRTTPQTFADEAVVEAMERLIEALGDDTTATDGNLRQLRALNRKLSSGTFVEATGYQEEMRPSGPARGA